MHLLATTNLGIMALAYLAASSDPVVAINDIAGASKAKPAAFKRPTRILIENGIIASKTGQAGGYNLVRDPKTLLLGEMIKLLEEDFTLAPVMELDQAGVVQFPNSVYRFALERAKSSFFVELNRYTIADIALDPYTRVAFNIDHLPQPR